MTRPAEVAVRQNGQEHAVATPDLEGQVLADLDGQPTVHLPPEVGVVYHDGANDDLATDGAGATRTEVEMRGFAMPEDAAMWATVLGCSLFVGSGAMLATDEPLIGILMLAAGALLTYVGARTFWSDRS